MIYHSFTCDCKGCDLLREMYKTFQVIMPEDEIVSFENFCKYNSLARNFGPFSRISNKLSEIEPQDSNEDDLILRDMFVLMIIVGKYLGERYDR